MKTDSKILIKFPTRGRPAKFFNVLQEYIDKADDLSRIAFLISMDVDDSSMNNEPVREHFKHLGGNAVKIVYFYGNNTSKVQAINADMDKVTGWDIVLLASDDMIPVVRGYDTIIRSDMNDHFRDMDGVLWYSDGGQNNINTLSIMGKKYYDEFNYIYNPEYISLWCDNEFTDVSLALNKCYKSDKVIIEHQHPVYQKTNYDELYVKNESFFHVDKETYERRKERNFDIKKNNGILFSVLLLGIPERLESFQKLTKKINDQIVEHSAEKKVELLALVDNKNRSVGSKRQSLLDICKGKYITFIDDDDDISNDYIFEIVNALEKNNNVDVVTFEQIAHINQNEPSKIIFSLKYENEEYYPNGVIKRKPFHMCVWNTDITKQVKFPDISKTEDWVWLEQLCKIAKTEYNIPKVLYHYIFNSDTTTSHD